MMYAYMAPGKIAGSERVWETQVVNGHHATTVTKLHIDQTGRRDMVQGTRCPIRGLRDIRDE